MARAQKKRLVTVRPACEADRLALDALWRSVDELHARLLPGYFRRAHSPVRPSLFVAQALDARDQTLLVAEIAGKVIGLVHVEIYDTPPLPVMVPRRRAHIEDLVVAEEQQRSGVGRRLMEQAACWAREQGATQVVLTVWRGNDAARRFYESLGYCEVSRALELDL
jgi:ribosomal protein S18 acetylase RimI-like enzyme